MARAFRGESLNSDRRRSEVESWSAGGAASIPSQRCPTCDADFTVLVRVAEDQTYCLDRFKNHLRTECPKHREHYKICESPRAVEEVVGET